MSPRVLIALGIALAIGLTRSFRSSSSPLLQALARPRGVKPTGTDGQWTVRDHLRAATAQVVTSVLAIGLGITALGLADHWKTGTPENTVASIPGLTAMFYGFFFLWLTGRSLLRATIARVRNRRGRVFAGRPKRAL